MLTRACRLWWSLVLGWSVATGRSETPPAPAASTAPWVNPAGPRPLRVSADGHHLECADHTPFFWLADTAWELFHRLNAAEADLYLTNRAAKGFTVIQAVLLAELDGLTVPNAEGELPLIDQDPTRPNEAYFAHVDRIVARGNALGLTLALLPTWGDKFNLKWGVGPEIFTPENARRYGRWVGERYRDADVVWILGGDRLPEEAADYAVIDALAAGLRDAVGDRQLITYHPSGGSSSSQAWHERPWLDFNLFQSGHSHRDEPNYRLVAHDRNLRPAKPVIDGEPCYEEHPVDWKPAELGWFNDFDVRRAAWWALLAGAAGHTYGHHAIWQLWQPGRAPISAVRVPWISALDYPGAWQMGVLRRTLEGLPWQDLEPRPEAVRDGPTETGAAVLAAFDRDGSCAVAYAPFGHTFGLDLRGLAAGSVRVSWIDPRTGFAIAAPPVAVVAGGGGPTVFDPPGEPARGNDWVLILRVTRAP